jgi:hypothetical protein
MVDTALAAGVLASRNKASMSTEEFAAERIVLKANGFTFDALAEWIPAFLVPRFSALLKIGCIWAN